MSGIQKLFRLFLPRPLFRLFRKSSHNWLYACPCGHKQDLWDAGGMQGEGTAKKTWMRCPVCDQRTWHDKRKKTLDEQAALPGIPPEAEEGVVFVSARDWWITLLVWGVAVLMLGAGLLILVEEPEAWFVLPGMIFGGLLGPWFWWSTEYAITETELHLRSGCFHKMIPLADIRAVRPGRLGMSFSFAFSMHHLQIEAESCTWRYAVSPLERGPFLVLLKKRCPQLVLEGELLS